MQIENTALVNDNEMWRVAATVFLTLSDDVGLRKKPQCDPESTLTPQCVTCLDELTEDTLCHRAHTLPR